MTLSIRTHQLFFHLLYWALLPSPFIFSFQERKPETSCLSFASVASRKILLTGFTAPSSFAEVLLLLVVFFSSAGQFTFPKMMMNWQSRIWICYLNQYKLWNRSVTNSPVVFINRSIIPCVKLPNWWSPILNSTHFEFYPFWIPPTYEVHPAVGELHLVDFNLMNIIC